MATYDEVQRALMDACLDKLKDQENPPEAADLKAINDVLKQAHARTAKTTMRDVPVDRELDALENWVPPFRDIPTETAIPARNKNGTRPSDSGSPPPE